jgi:hypothetical protein
VGDDLKTLFNIDSSSVISIAAYSAKPTEAEWLLLPGTFVRVLDVVYITKDLVIVQLEECEPPFDPLPLCALCARLSYCHDGSDKASWL